MKLDFSSDNSTIALVEEDFAQNGHSENNSEKDTTTLRAGIKAAQRGDRAEARQLLMRVTEADPGCESAWLWLASISEYPEELLIFLNNILDINPENERAIEWAKATKSLLAKTFVQRGIEAHNQDQKQFAKQCFMQAIVHDNRNEMAWLWLASVTDAAEEKIGHFNRVLEINPDNEQARESIRAAKEKMMQAALAKAENAFDGGDRKKAEKHLSEVFGFDPQNEDAWFLKSRMADSFEEKTACYEKLLELNPENKKALKSLNEAKQERTAEYFVKAADAAEIGDPVQASEFLAEVFILDPDHKDAWFLKSGLSDSFEEKMSCLEKVLELDSENEKAKSSIRDLKNERAAEFFEKANDAANKGDHEQANEYLAEVFNQNSDHEDGWLLKASLTDSFEEKTECLEKTLALNPENEKALEALKELKQSQVEELFAKANDAANEGNREHANELLTEVFNRNPNHEDAWILKSRLTDSFEEKIACFEKILEFNPANETAQAGVKLRAMLNVGAPKAEEPVSFPNEETAEQKSEEEFTAESTKENLAENQEEITVAENQEVENERKAEEQIAPVSAFENETTSAETEEFKDFMAEILEEEKKAVLIELPAQTEELAAEEKAEENYSENTETVEEENFAEEVRAEDETQEYAIEENQSEKAEDSAAEFERPEDVFAEYAENYGVEDFSKTEESVEEESVAEAVAAEVFEPAETSEKGFHAEMTEAENSSEENFGEDTSANVQEVSEKSPVELKACAFCETNNEAQAFVCVSCRSLLTLSDMEMILAYTEADQDVLREAVARMEAEDVQDGLESEDLVSLAVGYINLKDLRRGLDALQKASKLDPNNVVLKSQAHSLAIRLAEIEEKDAVHSSMPKDRTIMVVDDSATVRKLISGKLEKSGHIVITAVDGMDAMAKLNDVVPDLILLDITMPRMDGYQVCKLIRNSDAMKEVPVVMISGKDGFFDKVRGRMAGTTGYITKPFGPETLMKMLDTYLV